MNGIYKNGIWIFFENDFNTEICYFLGFTGFYQIPWPIAA